MKKWFAKFRISAALDAGKQPSSGSRLMDSLPEDVRQFAQNSAALDLALKETQIPSQTPASLHDSIMRAVRKTQPEPARSSPLSLRWLPASAFGLLAVLALWWSLQNRIPVHAPTAQSEPLAVAAMTLDMGQELSTAVPTAVMSPVSQEWSRLNQDMTNTVNYLLASIPFETISHD